MAQRPAEATPLLTPDPDPLDTQVQVVPPAAPAARPAIARLIGRMTPRKGWLKSRVILALVVLAIIPASLPMIIIFLGSGNHHPIDGFPLENGVGFWA